MKARRAVVVVSAAQHSRVHRCWHLLIQTLHCGWRVLHCGRRVLHCGRRRSIEIGMLVHKDLHCWSVLRIFTNQGKVSSNIFVNIKIFLRNLRKYLIIYPLDKKPWFGPLCIVKLREGSLAAVFPDHEYKLWPLLAHHGLHPAVQGVAHVVQGHQLRDGAGVAQPGHLATYGNYKILKTNFSVSQLSFVNFEL